MSGFARRWGDGPREVVALHCSLAHSGAWEGVVRALGPGLRVTAPDILGHGKAPDIDPGRDLHDQCYEAVLPHLPEGRFDAVGHSFGATLALRLAEELPERVRSLTLIDPVLFAAPIALAASIGFMLPVATPPNAIVFGFPDVTRQNILRAGAPLDVIGLFLAAGLGPLFAWMVF